ncbi:MAG: xanthine dehydrogenase family protein subunit M [Peptococcaceae bacterium]|nr:xanthine dehydrogenase family protein subunit M [Peptococcaceae bacterium]
MRPAEFEYHESRTVEEALSFLQLRGDEGVKVLAGGLSLVPMMKLRLAQPAHLVDITKIPTLSYIEESGNGGLRIGALTTYAAVSGSELVQKRCPILAEVTGILGDPQIRNVGTIGGNISNADPASDIGPMALALDVEMGIAGPQGRRTVKAADFYVDLFTTALDAGELLVEIVIPPLPSQTGFSYTKLNQRRADMGIVNAFSSVTLDGDIVKDVKVTVGAVAATPVRALQTEKILKGNVLTDELIVEAANAAADGIKPETDVHATAEYRTEMVKVLVKRTLTQAVKRAR